MSQNMPEIIQTTIFLLVSIIGYVPMLIMSAQISWIPSPNRGLIRKCKWWFYIAQGLALVLALYIMDIDQNLIPIMGFLILLLMNMYTFMMIMPGLALLPHERSPRAKKLMKIGFWLICSSVIVFAILISI
jgi:lysylphosphatidylglycerol synthetase-like protein (DUF2156 family)